MILYKWVHDLYVTDSDGIRHNMGHWSTENLHTYREGEPVENETHTEGTESPTDGF